MSKLLLCMACIVVIATVLLSDAHAAQPEFPVINTSETAPDGNLWGWLIP